MNSKMIAGLLAAGAITLGASVTACNSGHPAQGPAGGRGQVLNPGGSSTSAPAASHSTVQQDVSSLLKSNSFTGTPLPSGTTPFNILQGGGQKPAPADHAFMTWLNTKKDLPPLSATVTIPMIMKAIEKNYAPGPVAS